MMRRKDTHKGTDTVLIDLGFDDAEELSAKAILAVKLNQLIRSRGLSQTGAAAESAIDDCTRCQPYSPKAPWISYPFL